MAKEDINNEIPHGWQWITEWKIDTDGPVSSDGQSNICYNHYCCLMLHTCISDI